MLLCIVVEITCSLYNLIGKMFGLIKSAVPNKAHSLMDLAVEDDARRVCREISAIAARFQDALAKKALSEVLDIVTDDVVLLTASGAPTVGRTAVGELCLSLFRRFDFAERPVAELLGAQAIGNVAITGGGFLAKLSPIEGGIPAKMRGRIVVVFRNEDGAWRLARGLTWATWIDDSPAPLAASSDASDQQYSIGVKRRTTVETSRLHSNSLIAGKMRVIAWLRHLSEHRTGWRGLQLLSASVLRALCPDQLKESRNGTTDDVSGHGTTRRQ